MPHSMFHRLTVSLGILLLCACEQSMSEGLSDTDKSDIASIVIALKAATMAGDNDAQRVFYTEDAVHMIPDRAEPVRGLSNFIFNDTIPLTYNFEIEEIDGSGDHAWMRGTMRQTYSADTGKIAIGTTL